MTLPALFPNTNHFDIPYRKSDGVINPDQTMVEPGMFVDTTRNDVLTGHFPPVVQVVDYELTGTDPSTGLWTITVTPLTTQAGTAAAAFAMAAASAEFTAAADTFDDTVIGLVAAVNASTLTVASAMTGSNIASYVVASVSPLNPHSIRLTARAAGAVFSAALVSATSGDSYTATTIANPVTDTVKVGLYYGLDTTKGTNGYDALGKPYVTKMTSSIAAANIIGPIFKGADTQPVARGFAYREYVAGQNIPVTRYGHVAAYADSVIALSSGPEAVYVRHTDSGDYLAGMVTDAAGAALGATANLWTGTVTATDSTLYQVQIQVVNNDGVLISETISFTSGVGTTVTLISNGLRANLATKISLSGLVTGSGTTTTLLTGPADGRAVTVTNAGTGVIAFVETDPEVSTHTRTTRGDKFLAPTTRIGSAPVAVPVAA